jgi:hypothetical protein
MEGPIPSMTRFELARFMAWQQPASMKVTTDLEIALEWLGIEAANQANAIDPQKNAPDG